MKKLSILFVSVLTLGLTVVSCNSDDDNEGAIEGKWEASQYGIIVNGQEHLEPVISDGGCAKQIIELLSDGTFKDTYSNYYDGKCNPSIETGTWTKSGKTLTLKFEGETEGESAEIVELTDSTLKTKSTYTEEGQTITAVNVFVRK